MNKKVVAIYGSYRKNGNSATILNLILDEIKEKNVEIEKFYLSDLAISPCKGCFYCRKNNECVINDDMKTILKRIKEADKVLISIPVFMFQAASVVKVMLDRLYPILEGEPGRYTRSMNDKDTILVYSQGSPKEDSFKEYMEFNKKSLALLGLKVKETIICTKSNTIGSVLENVDLCNKAEAIGKNLF